MIPVIEEIRHSGRILRELADRGHVHVSRVPIVANYLNVVLPCLSKSLRDITSYYDDKTVTRELRWRKMYHEMKKEADIELFQRFLLYNRFLSSLVLLLTREKTQDRTQIELLKARVMVLRERQGLPAPTQAPVTDLIRQEGGALVPLMRERPHWAEQVFAAPLSSRTDMHGPQRSQARGPFVPAGGGARFMPDAARVLLRRPFDNERLYLMIIINAANVAPYFVLRVYDGGAQFFSFRGIHEICVHQVGNSLRLKRWSHSIQGPKLWAVLSFVTWEGKYFIFMVCA